MSTLVRKNRGPSEDNAHIANAIRAANLAADKKAENIKAYDVKGMTVLTDAFVICTAASEPQVKAIFNAVRDGMKEVGIPPVHTEGGFDSGWLLIDFGDVIFHLFRGEARAFYDLDGMWGDATEIPLDLE